MYFGSGVKCSVCNGPVWAKDGRAGFDVVVVDPSLFSSCWFESNATELIMVEITCLNILALQNHLCYMADCLHFWHTVRGCRPGKIVQMTEAEVRGLCIKSREIFLSQPILLELEAPLKICGENTMLVARSNLGPSLFTVSKVSQGHQSCPWNIFLHKEGKYSWVKCVKKCLQCSWKSQMLKCHS